MASPPLRRRSPTTQVSEVDPDEAPSAPEIDPSLAVQVVTPVPLIRRGLPGRTLWPWVVVGASALSLLLGIALGLLLAHAR